MIKTGTGREEERGREGPRRGNNQPPEGTLAAGGRLPSEPPSPPANQAYTSQDYQPQPIIDSVNGGGFVPGKLYQNDFYQQGGYIVNPTPIEPKVMKQPTPNRGRDNFIVDLKSGALVMVVEASLLPKMKDLIKKLDVPKKMVQIETLIAEKRLIRHDSFGLNLLRIGSDALNQNLSSFFWNNLIRPSEKHPHPPNNLGVTEYMLSRKGDHGIPAFDLAYRFLIQQDDIQLNVNPTVVTINQTPAKIAVVTEQSINTGIFLVPNSTQLTQERSFTRAQYGITIIITPTIHYLDDENEYSDNVSYISMDTDITFDTVAPSANEQPLVTRRHVNNQIRIRTVKPWSSEGCGKKIRQMQKTPFPF